MDLYNHNLALMKGEFVDRERRGSIDTGITSQDIQLASDLENRMYSLLKYKVDHEQPNLQPSRRYMSMDAMRRLAEEQSIKPELETINASIRSHPEIKGGKKRKGKAKGGVTSAVYFTLNPYKMSLNEADKYSSVQELYNHDDYVAAHGGNERHIEQMLERNLAADPNSLKGFNFYAKNVTHSIDSEYDWYPGQQRLAYNAIGPKYTRKY
jgi:hypothetical protein